MEIHLPNNGENVGQAICWCFCCGRWLHRDRFEVTDSSPRESGILWDQDDGVLAINRSATADVQYKDRSFAIRVCSENAWRLFDGGVWCGDEITWCSLLSDEDAPTKQKYKPNKSFVRISLHKMVTSRKHRWTANCVALTSTGCISFRFYPDYLLTV